MSAIMFVIGKPPVSWYYLICRDFNYIFKRLSLCFCARDPICIFQGSNYFYGWESSVNNILEFISETKQRMEMTANYDRYS